MLLLVDAFQETRIIQRFNKSFGPVTHTNFSFYFLYLKTMFFGSVKLLQNEGTRIKT